jgi:hypothetical protein
MGRKIKADGVDRWSGPIWRPGIGEEDEENGVR